MELSITILLFLILFPQPQPYVQRHQTIPSPSYIEGRCSADKAQDKIEYAWQKYRDFDFILTVDAESVWDVNAVGDQGRAHGFCQYRQDISKWNYDTYTALQTWEEKLDMCYRSYKTWKDKGILHKRLYGYNVRHKNKLRIVCT